MWFLRSFANVVDTFDLFTIRRTSFDTSTATSVNTLPRSTSCCGNYGRIGDDLYSKIHISFICERHPRTKRREFPLFIAKSADPIMDTFTGTSKQQSAGANTYDTIADAVWACRNSLESCCSFDDRSEADWANNRLLDLNYWIASVGALANGHASLDYRLHMAQDEEGHTTSILINLLDLLNQLVRDYQHASE